MLVNRNNIRALYIKSLLKVHCYPNMCIVQLFKLKWLNDLITLNSVTIFKISRITFFSFINLKLNTLSSVSYINIYMTDDMPNRNFIKQSAPGKYRCFMVDFKIKFFKIEYEVETR